MSEREIFIAALQKEDAAVRQAFLDEACAGRPELRQQVEDLLRLHEDAGSFLEGQAGGAATGPFVSPPSGEASGSVEQPGTLIGRYKLLEQIGEGGFGVVFMALQQEPLRRKVALKVLKPGMDSGQVLARFEAERQALALMDHANIARVHDAGTTQSGRPYFVMELVKGVPITHFCDEHQLTTDERLKLFVDVCAAVQHAHHKGIIHRDLKPSNVLVSRQDTAMVKVIDFGIAKALGQQLTERTLFTGFAQMIGTPLYMSPEQAGMSDLDVDTRSDVYSLGVLLYELLTGTTPFDAERLRQAGYDEMRRIIREEEPPKPSTRFSTLGQASTTVSTQRKSDPKRLRQLFRGELDWMVMKALEKDRNRRYESASAFAADVQRYLHDDPVLACPPSASYRLRKFVRRHKGPVLAASVIVLLLVAGIVGTSTGLVRALAAEQQAVQDRDDKDTALCQALRDRRQARQALNLTTDLALEDLLGRQIQLTGQHQQFLKKVLAEHAAFAAATAEDSEGRQSQADAYFRVGRIRWLLGEARESESAYRAAVALQKQLVAEFPARADFQRDLAASQDNLALLLRETGRLKQAESTHRAALDLRTKLVHDSRSTRTFRRDLARSHLNLGLLLFERGRLKEAEESYGKALVLLKQLVDEFPTRADCRENLAMTWNNLGGVLYATGRRKEAEAAYGKAQALFKQLATDLPNIPDLRREWAISYHNRGGRLRDAGRLKEAETAYRKALALLQQLVNDFPARPDFRQDVARSQILLARLLRETGQLKEAEESCRDAMPLVQQLATALPTRPDFRHGLAASYDSLGLLLVDTGRPKEAEDAFGKALAIHKRLADGFPARPAFRRDLATCHHNLGNLLAKTGRPKEAEDAYRAAVALQKQLADAFPQQADFRRGLALGQHGLGSLLSEQKRYKEAEEAFGMALAIRKQLANAFPNQPGCQVDLAFTWNSLGILLAATGRPKEAEGAYGKALAMRKQLADALPTRPDIREELARTWNNLGVLLVEQQNHAEAKKCYAAALAIHKRLGNDFPTLPEFQNNLASTLVNIAILHNHRQQYAAAVSLVERARKQVQAALKTNPGNPTYRQCGQSRLRVLAWSQYGLADHARLAATADEVARFVCDPPNDTCHAARYLCLCVELANKDAQLDTVKRKELAKGYADKAVALLRQAAARAGKDATGGSALPPYRRQIATCSNEVGTLLSEAGRPKEAEEAYRDAVAIRKQLAKDFPNRTEFCQELARSHNNLGNVLYTTGRSKEAEEAYRAALALQKRLVARFPTDAEHRNGLAGTLVNLALVHNQRREFAAAVPFLEQARPHHQAALKASPGNATYRLFYRNNVRTLAQSQLGQAEHAQLALTAEELVRFGDDPVNDTYLAACFLGRCVMLAGKDAELDEARRKELAEGYANRALELLRQAVKRGYKNAAHMRKNPDLEPLRVREEFNKLLIDLAGKTRE
jgi:serine/threonine protein kinase/tetratricopeptide (TPR) repeat protein